MKALLYAAVEQAPSADVSESYVLDSFYGKFDEKFFHYCDKELAKINTFYSGKIIFKILSSFSIKDINIIIAYIDINIID